MVEASNIVDCHHTYSKSMNQPFPRKCVRCGAKEPQQDISDEIVISNQFGPDDKLFSFRDNCENNQKLGRGTFMYTIKRQNNIKD